MNHRQPPAAGDVTGAKMGVVGSIVGLLLAAVTGVIYMLRDNNSAPVGPAPATTISTPTEPSISPNGTTGAEGPKEKEKGKEKSVKPKPPLPDPG